MEALSPLQLQAYLERVGILDGIPAPTLEGVTAVHQAHLLSVPFESLDIHTDRPISIEAAAIFDKLVARRRGGFCYENNGLFAAAVSALGLEVDLLSARVARGDSTFGPPFDHLVLRAHFNGAPYLLDVGFGEGFRTPLRIDGEWHDQAPSAPYRARHVDGELLVEHRKPDQIKPDYRIDLELRHLTEFIPMCHYHQNSPDSGFTQQWTASLATSNGRVTVVHSRLVETLNGQRTETPVPTADELADVLADRFGITDVDTERLMATNGPQTTDD
ncbi:MAG: arylamine N-acetyltransferase [Acidimicrobiia bacterium]|nr:arylamine N-acetyltransferase [Acidimicrobiia bacterium]